MLGRRSYITSSCSFRSPWTVEGRAESFNPRPCAAVRPRLPASCRSRFRQCRTTTVWREFGRLGPMSGDAKSLKGASYPRARRSCAPNMMRRYGNRKPITKLKSDPFNRGSLALRGRWSIIPILPIPNSKNVMRKPKRTLHLCPLPWQWLKMPECEVPNNPHGGRLQPLPAPHQSCAPKILRFANRVGGNWILVFDPSVYFPREAGGRDV